MTSVFLWFSCNAIAHLLCGCPPFCFFLIAFLNSGLCFFTYTAFHSSASHSILSSLFSFPWQIIMWVCPYGPTYTALLLPCSIYWDYCSMCSKTLYRTGKEMKSTETSLATDNSQLPETAAYYVARFKSEVHSLFYKMWSTSQNCYSYYLTATASVTLLNTYGFYRTSQTGFYLTCIKQK